ncbi:MAG: hypothetical protein ACR2LV_09050 [Solirubrobacteraceae bacterium]
MAALKILVLTSESISARQLRDALSGDDDSQDAEIMVVAPALQEGRLKFWLSDADEAIAKAEEVSEATVKRLGDAGIAASGDTGESDPMTAIQDVLATFAADRIVLFVHTDSKQRYLEDVDPEELQQRFGISVDRAVVSGS